MQYGSKILVGQSMDVTFCSNLEVQHAFYIHITVMAFNLLVRVGQPVGQVSFCAHF